MLRLLLALALATLAVACSPTEPTFRVSASARTPEVPSFTAAAEPSRDGWNRAQIDWVTHEEAMRRAAVDRQPVCVVMHADWCGHCHNFMHVFEDPRIVERAQRMHMVLLDVDAEPAIASRYATDGGYVPRTYFVEASGSIMNVDAHRPRFQHFFHESDPTSLLSGMDEALAQ
jgi:thiol:disulfide interchange protein